jgi:hypothetical protein
VRSRTVEVSSICASHASALEAVDHAIRSVEAALAKPRYVVPKGETKAYLEMRRDLPYIIHETDLPETQILVNRDYKPLGDNARTGERWVKYEDFKNMHVRLTTAEIKSVVSDGRERGLFGDGNPPWAGRRGAEAYLERLKRLRVILRLHSSALGRRLRDA